MRTERPGIDVRGRAVSLGLMIALAACVSVRGQAAATQPAGAKSARSVRLDERNRLAWEALRLRHAGKTTESTAVADRMLAIERSLFAAESTDLAGALEFVARIHEFDADFGPALAALREAVAIREKAARVGDWVLVDDRFAAERIGRLSELDAAKRARFPRAPPVARQGHDAGQEILPGRRGRRGPQAGGPEDEGDRRRRSPRIRLGPRPPGKLREDPHLPPPRGRPEMEVRERPLCASEGDPHADAR